MFYKNNVEGLWPDPSFAVKTLGVIRKLLAKCRLVLWTVKYCSTSTGGRGRYSNSSDDFIKNNVARPGICRVEPRQVFTKDLNNQEKAKVTIFGKLLDGSRGQNFVEYYLRKQVIYCKLMTASYVSWIDTMIEAITPILKM